MSTLSREEIVKQLHCAGYGANFLMPVFHNLYQCIESLQNESSELKKKLAVLSPVEETIDSVPNTDLHGSTNKSAAESCS